MPGIAGAFERLLGPGGEALRSLTFIALAELLRGLDFTARGGANPPD